MTPDDLHPIEVFFKNWSYTAGAIMSSILFLVAMGRIIGFAVSALNSIITKAAEQAITNQRQDNQGDVISEFVKIIKDQQLDIKRYCKAKEDDAIDSALCKTLLANNNITPIDIPK